MNLFFYVPCIFVTVFHLTGGKLVLKTLPNGVIQGKQEITAKGTKYDAFLGIPYASPPIGNLRFQPPQPVKNWKGMLNATINKNICHQYTETTTYTESEDCLFINVYAPKDCKKLAVMFWIYGGGFIDGYSSDTFYGPQYFMDYDVVVVTFNYRLGAFGFLSTQDLVLPGNIGLKDQIHALRWVQTNIHIFGGDPSKVTIFGESSGSASVSQLTLSKSTKDLYRAAIMQSGPSISPFEFVKDPKTVAYSIAKEIDSSFQPNKNSSEDLLKLFLKTPAKQLSSATKNIIDQAIGYWSVQFGPVIEPKHDGAVLTDKMFGLIEAGKFNRVPQMIGFTSEEALVIAIDEDSFIETQKLFDEDVTQLVNANINFQDEKIKRKVANSIKNYYVGNGTFLENQAATIKFSTESAVLSSIKEAKMKSKFAQIYVYQFSYDGPLGQNNITIDGVEKVGHFEDVYYMFKIENVDLENYPKADILTHERLLKMWTNFAKTMNPTPKSDNLLENTVWPVFSNSSGNQFLDIREHLTVQNNPKKDSFKFLDNLYTTYGLPPFYTY